MQKSRILSLASVAVALLLGSSLPAGAQAGGSADAQAIATYTLSMQKVEAFRDATNELVKTVQGDPELASRLEAQGDQADGDKSLDQLAARFDAEPKVKAALAAHGLSGREYMLVQLTMMQAMMAEALLGAQKQASLPQGVNPKNVEFVKAHKAELQQLLTSIQGGTEQ